MTPEQAAAEAALRREQGKPDAAHCHLCNTRKIARSRGKGIALLCPTCDGITQRKD